MTTTPWFPARWAPQDPDLIQLYSLPTPNGQKISICLEEMGLAYEPHRIDIGKGDQFDPDFMRISPGGKIPAMIDPHGPEDEPIMLMESIVMLQYLADKSGSLFPPTYRARMEAQQWLVFQASQVGPFFGQFGHFYKFARDKTKDNYALERYTKVTQRLLATLNTRLQDREHIMGDYSIVDIAMVPWVETLAGFYEAWGYLNMRNYSEVERWRKQVSSRPAYQRGKDVCGMQTVKM
jgi:GST-like protein